MRKIYYLTVFIITFILPALKAETIDVFIKSTLFHLEIVSTQPLKEQGLSNRTSLESNGGMFFFYEKDEIREFFMYKCHIPLDLIYLDHQGTIVDIMEMQVEPTSMPKKNLKRYVSSIPVRYVIELNVGTAKKLELKKGEKIQLPAFNFLSNSSNRI